MIMILREMKRQIGSLQRQVGKAKKCKELRDRLRGLDIHLSRQRIRSYDQELEHTSSPGVSASAPLALGLGPSSPCAAALSL